MFQSIGASDQTTTGLEEATHRLKLTKIGRRFMAGRPVEPVPQSEIEEICQWISEGKTLRDYCRQDGKPHYSTIYAWLLKDDEFAQRFAQARDIGADVIAEEALSILDEMPERVVSATSNSIDSGYVSWQKARAEFRLKLLAKWNPKKYGDKVDLKHSGSVGLSINIDLGDE
jgi:hypothetical protein